MYVCMYACMHACMYVCLYIQGPNIQFILFGPHWATQVLTGLLGSEELLASLSSHPQVQFSDASHELQEILFRTGHTHAQSPALQGQIIWGVW